MAKEFTLKKALFNRAHVRILVCMLNNNATIYPLTRRQLAIETNTTASHVTGILSTYEKEGLIESRRKDKRTYHILLTDKGERVATHLRKIFQILK